MGLLQMCVAIIGSVMAVAPATIAAALTQHHHLGAAFTRLDLQGDANWSQFKEQWLRPYYLPASFLGGSLTVGLRTAAANFTFVDTVRLGHE